MTTAAQTREPEMGLTFEKVWAMFHESDLRMRKLSEETDRQMKETDRKMQETDRQMKETDRKMQETDRLIQETAQQMKETDRIIQEVARHIKDTDRHIKATDVQIGRLGNRFGELAEHLVAPNIVQKFNALGFHFDEISELRHAIHDEISGQIIAEFDILLENRDSVIGVEVKSKPSYDDVGDHVKRLRILRRTRDKKNDKRKIYGALAGAIMTDNVKTAALEAGFYVITQTGDTVKIDIPEGFTPKVW
jgi:septal ring factor EnvC (AmiA/AmiB activator)